jgi:hypothetical protein
MSSIQISNTSGEAKFGETACGARVPITPDTPYINYRDSVVYFCAQDCKLLYDEDPLSSCMAARLLSGK